MRHAGLKLGPGKSSALAGWTQEACDLLTKEWPKSGSVPEMRQMLAERLQIVKGRNAVIGKLHRLGLAGQGPSKGASKARAKRDSNSIAWTSAADMDMVNMHHAGATCARIADHLKSALSIECNGKHVYYRLVALGVYQKKAKSGSHAGHGSKVTGAWQVSTTETRQPRKVLNIIEAEPSHSTPMLCTDADACKWPTSHDVRDMAVCGQPASSGAYCSKHAAIAYRRAPGAGRDAMIRKPNVDYKIGRVA